jgi:hypothetical protein
MRRILVPGLYDRSDLPFSMASMFLATTMACFSAFCSRVHRTA